MIIVVCLFIVSGCINSDPIKTTNNCLPNSEQTLTIHGTGFIALCPDNDHNTIIDYNHCTHHIQNNYCVFVGNTKCIQLKMNNMYKLTCTLASGNGNELPVMITRLSGECVMKDVVAVMAGAVSFKPVINYREMFNQFVEYGVGGLKGQIDELYRRAFASRGNNSYINRLFINN